MSPALCRLRELSPRPEIQALGSMLEPPCAGSIYPMPMVSRQLLPLVFVGGALGTTLRYLIEILIGDIPQGQILVTSFVNLLGAALLGFVSAHKVFASSTRQSFWGVGFLGSFTTMSGLALITAGADLGLSAVGPIYWLIVLVQLVIGVAAYRLGLMMAGVARK